MNRKEKERKLMLLREKQKREQQNIYKNDFYSFCVYMDPLFFTSNKPHLQLIANAFQQIADGTIKKLAISMPPRAGKSYITSLFCAWLLGKHQDGSIMRNSYAAKLAEKFSKDIRDGIIPNPKYQAIFPIKVSARSSAVDGWSIEGHTQTAYFCAGVGGAITGFGCKTVAILDDSIKNIEEALSETVIESTWNWYTSTHLSRLESGCPEIHIATRWTRKDCIGRLTDENSEEYDSDYKVINIPALDDRGKSFCEEVHSTAEYIAIKKVTDEFIWEAEYMQHPVESKGLLYPIEDLKRFSMEELKTTDKEGKRVYKKADAIVGFTDTADKGSDFLCSPIGRKYGEYTYITDVVFTQDGVEITEPLVAEQIIDTKCDIMKIESNNGGSSFARNVRGLIKGKSPCMIIDEATTQNKETRILMNAGYIKEYFYFRNDYEPGSDYDKFMRYFTSYIKLGKNKHDDACFEAGTLVATITGNKPIETIKKGEYVITPFGIRKVLWSGITGEREIISKYGLNATPNHKIFINKYGFIPLDTLTGTVEYDIISLKELILWRYRKLLCSMELNTDLWGRENITLVSRRQMKEGNMLKDFMWQCGNFITGKKYQKVIKFITKMAILLIMTLAIWSAYQLGNMLKSTQLKIKKNLGYNLTKQEKKLMNGTKVLKVVNGILNMLKNKQKTIINFIHVFVYNAVNKLNLKEKIPCFAMMNVGENIKRNMGDMTIQQHVLCVGKSSQVEETKQMHLKDKRVQNYAKIDLTIKIEKRKVYNLTIDKDHVYYANGLLVSNCDAITGLGEYLKYKVYSKPKPPEHYNFNCERPKHSIFEPIEVDDSYINGGWN